MGFSVAGLRKSLGRGQPGRVWQNISMYFAGRPQQELAQLTNDLANTIRWRFTEIDPVIQEKFIGHMFIGCGRAEEGKEALLRAASWEEARKKAQNELGLDFKDYGALYHFLGANDFRDYARKRDEEKSRSSSLILDEKTVAYLFFAQEMEKALPLVKNFPDATWLTVGDGRHAFEAIFLKKHGARVFPTNLDPTLLEEASEMGLIDDYGVENIENLSFPDKSFDFICCKDTLHHSMFPYKALYEMLRVAAKGVFLIEPFDHSCGESAIFNTRVRAYHYFEEGPGNYAYSFSERELEKLGVSHGWKLLATRGICCLHDHPVPLTSTEPADLERQRALVEQREQKAARKEESFTSMCSILLREQPSPQLREDLLSAGYALADLDMNPHLERDVLKSLAAMYKRS